MTTFSAQSRIFGDLVSIYALSKGAEDKAAGRTENEPVLRAESVPCYIEELNSEVIAAIQSQGFNVNTFAFLAADPGPLLQGGRLDVQRRAGVSYAGTPGDPRPKLRVQRVQQSSIWGVALWRVECLSRS